MRRGIVIAALIGLSACAPTAGDLQDRGATRLHVDENYQSVYRRLVRAVDCRSGADGGGTSMDGVSQLYPELGLGEVGLKQSSMFGNQFLWHAEVRQAGAGSDVTIYGAPGARDVARQFVEGERATCYGAVQ